MPNSLCVQLDEVRVHDQISRGIRDFGRDGAGRRRRLLGLGMSQGKR